MADGPRISFRRAFAGRERTFRLGIGEAEELERLCNAGIGTVAMRLVTQSFYVADVRETIRLALMGGGASEADATGVIAICVDSKPLGEFLPLASDCVTAYIAGLPEETKRPAPDAKQPAPGDIAALIEIGGAIGWSPKQVRGATIADLVAAVKGFKRANGVKDTATDITAEEAIGIQAREAAEGKT